MKTIFRKIALGEYQLVQEGDKGTKHGIPTHLWDSEETTTTRAGAERHKTS